MKNIFAFLVFSLVLIFCSWSCKEQENAIQAWVDGTEPLKIEGFDSGFVPKLTDFDTINPSNYPILDSILNSSELSSFLTNNNFSTSESYRLEADSVYTFYAIKLVPNSTSSSKEYYLVSYPDGAQGNSLIFEQEDFDGYVNIAVYEYSNYSLVASGNFLDGGVGPVAQINCDDETDTFNDCMDCAFNVLTDDWLSTAACMLSPWSCIAAATIHCL